VKTRIAFLLVVIAAVVGFYYSTIRPTLTPAQPALNRRLIQDYRPPDIPPPQLPQPKIEMPALPLPRPGSVLPASDQAATVRRDNGTPLRMEVPIRNGATIDFSFGAPHVRSQGEDQVALDKALKEMAEATKDVQFPPQTAPGKK
jgi:hypothetical protein